MPVGGLPNRFLTVPFDAIPVWYKKDVWLAGYVVVNFTIQFNSILAVVVNFTIQFNSQFTIQFNSMILE